MTYYAETINDAPAQRKFNGDYGFPFVATADETEAGTVIIRGALIGFSNRNLEAGAYGTAELHGTVTLTKAAATVFVQGDEVYWDATASQATTTATGNKKIGLCKLAPGTGGTSVEVLLNA